MDSEIDRWLEGKKQVDEKKKWKHDHETSSSDRSNADNYEKNEVSDPKRKFADSMITRLSQQPFNQQRKNQEQESSVPHLMKYNPKLLPRTLVLQGYTVFEEPALGSASSCRDHVHCKIVNTSTCGSGMRK
ncbi:hypothetical protein TNCV_734181 [Trichonephila clavipes]|nr:hypothetical protein TNCV_734181 [Trichonephila clavipes]